MRILVHSMFLSDVEDPEIYAAEPIMAFEETEKGQWLYEHSYEQMTYDIIADPSVFGSRINIYAWLNEQDLTFYRLKWG